MTVRSMQQLHLRLYQAKQGLERKYGEAMIKHPSWGAPQPLFMQEVDTAMLGVWKYEQELEEKDREIDTRA